MNKTMNAKTHFNNLKEDFKEWIHKSHPLKVGAAITFIILAAIGILPTVISMIPYVVFLISIVTFMWIVGNAVKDKIKDEINEPKNNIINS